MSNRHPAIAAMTPATAEAMTQWMATVPEIQAAAACLTAENFSTFIHNNIERFVRAFDKAAA